MGNMRFLSQWAKPAPLRRPHCHTSSLLSVPPTSDNWRNDLICFFTLDRVFHFAAMTAFPLS